MQNYNMDFFRKINNGYNSKSKKETTLYEIRESIAQAYDNTIDFQPDTLVDGEPMPLIVMEYHGSGMDRERIKNIEAPPSSMFNLGSKVDCYGMKWLVTEINYNHEVKLSGKMQLCNYPLKWQDEDGNIIVEDCVCSRYKTAATGEDINKVVTVDETRRNIFIQFNEHTAKLRQGKRFFIDLENMRDLKVYKLTDLNRTSYIYNGYGCFEMVCVEEEKVNERDRPDLMIADYVEPPPPLSPPIGSCEIRYNGSPTIKAGGSAKAFVAVFYDGDGNELDGFEPEWEIISPYMPFGEITLVENSPTSVSVRVDAKAIVGTVFTLKMNVDDDELGQFEHQVAIEIASLY